MPTTDTTPKTTTTDEPGTTRPGPRTETTTIPGTPGGSRPRRPRIDDAAARSATSPIRIGAVFTIAAAVSVGALVWAVVTGPADTSVNPSTHDRVELNRVRTLSDIATQPSSSYDRVELNRARTLSDIATRPASFYDRVELNRVRTLSDIATQPSSSYDRVELNRVRTLSDIATPLQR